MQVDHFILKTVTYLAGAGNDKNAPEIRPTEIKAMLRFWYRAIVCETNLPILKKREYDLFGNASDSENPHVSKVSIKALSHPEISSQNTTRTNLLPHHDGSDSDKRAFNTIVIKPKSSIDLDFIFRPDVTQDQIKCINNVFRSSLLLGGIGKRNRRGFGSMMLADMAFATPVSLADEIYSCLNAIAPGKFTRDINTIINRLDNTAKYEYPVIRQIFVGRSKYDTIDEALLAIGQASHDNSDPALGSGHPRMASPVVASIKPVGDKYAIVATFLEPKYPKNYSQVDIQKLSGFIGSLL